MDISEISTLLLPVTSPAQSATSSASARKSDKPDFADYIFNHPLPSTKDAQQTAKYLQTQGEDVQKKNNDIAKLLSVHTAVQKDVQSINDTKIYDGDPQAQIAAVLALNQKALEGDIKATPNDPNAKNLTTAKNGDKKTAAPSVSKSLLIDNEKARKDLLSKIGEVLDKLQKLAQDNDGALTVANLTPAQIADLKSKVEALLAKAASGSDGAAVVAQSANVQDSGETDDSKKTDAKDDNDALASMLAGLVKLLPQQQAQSVIVPQGISLTPIIPSDAQTSAPSDATTPNANDIISKLNSLLSTNQANSELTVDSKQTAAAPSAPKGSFNQLLKDFSDKKDSSNFGIIQDANVKTAPTSSHANPTPSTKNDGSLLTGWDFSDNGSFQFNASDISQGLMNNMAAQSSSALSITGPASVTNLVTQAASATTPMPATQMVAASIQKAASDGVNKITLELEPAELGKIEVRLSFGHDKTVKAVVVAEHSDTINMLQRDGHFLERAFQNAGLDSSDKSSLSFELAKEGYSFGRDQGSNSNSGGQNAKDDEVEPIQSTMNWHVDSVTGQTRYNILA